MPEDSLDQVTEEVVVCRRCPRLVKWRESVAAEQPKRFMGEEYWARPLPGFGDPDARIVVIGLAPAAHGGNRTGRVFTGDRSGDWLYASLHRTGLASQPVSLGPGDGMALLEAYITAAVRCAPPANKPTPKERDNCLPYLERELRLLTEARVLLALGAFAWDAAVRACRALDHEIPRPKPRFGHGEEAEIGPYKLLGTYHPSQQNTFTGRLTEEMLDSVMSRAKKLAR